MVCCCWGCSAVRRRRAELFASLRFAGGVYAGKISGCRSAEWYEGASDPIGKILSPSIHVLSVPGAHGLVRT
jgi:hypothetical protein